MVTVAIRQKMAEITGNHINSLSDFKTAKLCPRSSQLREIVPIRFSPIFERSRAGAAFEASWL